MNAQLDKLDQKILDILMENARTPLTKMARAVRLRKETVNYRLKRLVQSGLITSFHVVLNTDLLGFQHHVVFVQLIRMTAEKEKEFLNFLKKTEVHWVSLLAGKWGLMFDLYVQTGKELAASIQKMLSEYGANISEYVVMPVERKWYYFTKLIGETGALPWPTAGPEKRPTLDAIDWKIIAILGKNARASYAELTKEVPLTANAIKKRILHLEKTGVVLGYTILADYRKLGYEGYGVQLKLLSHEEERLAQIFKFFEGHPKIAMLYRYVLGQWDFDLRIMIKNSAEFRAFVSQLYAKFPEEFKMNDFYLILEEKIL